MGDAEPCVRQLNVRPLPRRRAGEVHCEGLVRHGADAAPHLSGIDEAARPHEQSGSPTEAGVYIGPLSRKVQVEFLKEQVQDAVSKGAMVLTGGASFGSKGYFFQPTVIVNVNHEMSIMKDETFGPVIGIMKVTSDEEAIGLMQDTEYGLTASVYSSSQQRAENILSRINAGTGYWNCCDRVSAALP